MTSELKAPPTALVIVLSNVASDPRVLREIDWLTTEGFVVDTLGLGSLDDIRVRDHFELAPQVGWSTSKWGRALMHASLTSRKKFRVMAQSRFPDAATDRVRSGDYDLLVFNDIELTPWLRDRSIFESEAFRAHVHLDLHEYFAPALPAGSWKRFRVDSYYRWTRTSIGHRLIDSRSVVAKGIADLYASEFAVAVPHIVRNAPPFAALEPTPVDPAKIELVHHGIAAWRRGLRELVDAMRLLDARFSLTFMLAGSERVIAELREYARDLGDRVKIVPPEPVTELPWKINRFDLEVMFFPPTTRNLEYALPNKLFEAVQGRLGLVMGPSVMMVEIVEEHHNGVVAPEWTAESLASALAPLSADDIRTLKAASHAAAHALSAEHERGQFLRAVGAV